MNGKFRTIIDSRLINEWDYSNNHNLDPSAVKLSSNVEVWWKCKKGHSWCARTSHRLSGRGCPYCSKKVNSVNNLLVRFPEIAAEWDVQKNNLTSDKVFPGNVKKYWWKCKNGHSYQASPNKRTCPNRRGCPYCSGRLVSKKNSLIGLFADIAKEFHPTKNMNVRLEDVTAYSQKKLWWICKRGHEWAAIVSNRTKGRGCPYCYSQVSKNELRIYAELKTVFEDVELKKRIDGLECDILIGSLGIAIEYDGVYWHKNKENIDRQKNIKLATLGIKLMRVRETGLNKIKPFDVVHDHKETNILPTIKEVLKKIRDNIKLSGAVKKNIEGYLHQGTYSNDSEYRALLERLPSPLIEKTLAYLFPDIAKEWHPAHNKGLLPSDVAAKSALMVWWKCKKGHEWESTIGNRSQGGNNCPYCAHQLLGLDNSLAIKRSDLAKEWNYIRNRGIEPSSVFAYTSKKYWWICRKGHEWQASPANRAAVGKGKNTKCPYCSNKKVNLDNCLTKTNPKLAKEWNYKQNGNIKPTMVTKGSQKRVWWQCSKGHAWEATISSRNRGNGCPYCSHLKVSDESSLLVIRPDLAEEWNYEKNNNITPRDVTAKSKKRVWWKCNKGHEWETTVAKRNESICGCPYCFRRRASEEYCLESSCPDLVREWNYEKNENLTPKEITKGSKKSVWWKCEKGHEWMAIVSYRSIGKYNCPECKRLKRIEHRIRLGDL